jgi:hypothetical protein
MKKLITAILSLIFVLSMYVPAVAVSHVESNSDIYASQDYLYDTLTIAGSGFESVQTFTLYDIETLASDQKLGLGYTNRYSTMTSGSVFSVHEYSGIRLYDFLVWCGLDESLPDSTQVKTVAKDGYDIRFTLGDLRSETYSRYSYKGDDKADETALPIIVAFASDGVPLVGPTGSQSVLKKFTAAEGYDESADNVGGPLRLIVGQKSSYDFNAHDCSKWLAAIVVGDDNGYVYDRVDTTQTDLSEPEPGGDWTHGEDYSDFTLKIHGTQANGVSYVSLSQIESMTDGVDRGYYAASAGQNKKCAACLCNRRCAIGRGH